MYLEIDEGFFEHQKTVRFCSLMQDSNAFAYVLRLWKWACRSSPDGGLVGMDAGGIEFVVGYRNMDGRCYAALAKSGFIDESAPGVPAAIHDWMEHTGAAIEKMEQRAEQRRELARDRQRRKRDRECSPAVTQEPRDEQRDSGVTVTHVTHPVQSSPVQIRSEREIPRAIPVGVPRAPRVPHAPGAATIPFLNCFDRYPRKDKKADAAAVFQVLSAEHVGGETGLERAILAAFDGGMLKRHPYVGEHQFRPTFEAFLAGRRWEDPPSEPDNPIATARGSPSRDIRTGGTRAEDFRHTHVGEVET